MIIPPHIAAIRRDQCHDCGCGADPDDACARCPRGNWGVWKTCKNGAPLPSTGQMVRNLLLTALEEGRALVEALPEIDAEELARRKVICAGNAETAPCPSYRDVDQRCAQCGCYLQFKARLRSQHCPIGKW